MIEQLLTFWHLAGKMSSHIAAVIIPKTGESSSWIYFHAFLSFFTQTIRFSLCKLLEVVDGSIDPLEGIGYKKTLQFYGKSFFIENVLVLAIEVLFGELDTLILLTSNQLSGYTYLFLKTYLISVDGIQSTH